MKKFKKLAATLLAASTMFTAAVSAQDLLSAPTPEASTIYINGTAIEAPGTLKTEEGLFIPLRAVCENLGFTITWHDDTELIEIVNSPVYITCTPRQDGYTFAKTAPMLLGTAPHLIDGVTYVPANFIDEILQGSYTVDEDGAVHIAYGEEMPAAESPEAAVAEVSIVEKGDGYIVVNDFQLGDVIVRADEQTVITDTEGNALTLDDLQEGRALEVQYGAAMTLSLPPMTTAVKIVQLDEIGHSSVQGSISELVYEDEKLVRIIVGDPEDPAAQTALNIGVSTEFLSADGTAADASVLKEGVTIRAWASNMATFSLPPQRFAEKIMIIE